MGFSFHDGIKIFSFLLSTNHLSSSCVCLLMRDHNNSSIIHDNYDAHRSYSPKRRNVLCGRGREREREKRRLVWGEWRKWRSSGEGMRERKRERESEEGDMCGECRKGRYSGEKKIYEKDIEG